MREGRCCPFKRRRPSRDLFPFPRKESLALAGRARWGGAGLGVGRRGACGGHPSFLSSLRWTGLPAQIRRRTRIGGDCAVKWARPVRAEGRGAQDKGAVTRDSAGGRIDPRTSEEI